VPDGVRGVSGRWSFLGRYCLRAAVCHHVSATTAAEPVAIVMGNGRGHDTFDGVLAEPADFIARCFSKASGRAGASLEFPRAARRNCCRKVPMQQPRVQRQDPRRRAAVAQPDASSIRLRCDVRR